MASHYAVDDEITLPDGTQGTSAYIPQSEVFRRPKERGGQDVFVDTSEGRRLILSEEWSKT